MNGKPRDEGLVRALGSWALAASLIGTIIGAGIFAVPSALAASVGAYAPFAFLGCALAMGTVAVCFAEGGSRIPTSGGVYGYIEISLGPIAGSVCGTLLWVEDALSCAGVTAALADVLGSVVPPPIAALVRSVAIIGAVGTITVVNLGGVQRGARLIGVMTAAKLIPLAIFLLVGMIAVHPANFSVPSVLSSHAPGRAVILAMFALTGMETALCASGEVAEPSRNIPRALALALLCVTGLYMAIQAIAQGILGPALASSSVPLADAIARVNPSLRLVMLTGAAVSMLGYMSSDILSTPRMLFAFGRDGLLPRLLGRVHPRTRVPHVAVLCYAALIITLAITGTFGELAVLATLAAAALYGVGCLAAWRLAHRGIAVAGTPLNFRWLGFAAIIGMASMLATIALASRTEILGLLALIGISAAAYLIQGRVRSKVSAM